MRRKRTTQGLWFMLAFTVTGLVASCANGAGRAEPVADQHDDSHEENEALNTLDAALASADVFITHIHGIGYQSDGHRLLVAAHDGLKIFESGEWRDAGAPHDFMGFTAVEGGFFSSGHPTVTSGLPNPLGVIFVEEEKWNISPLGFMGESDFHHMAAGYFSKTLYLVNTEETRGLGIGLNVSEDQGRNWQRREASGLRGTLRQLAVHPSDPLVSAYATTDGLYLSRNGGNAIERVIEREGGYAVAFSPDGRRVYLGGNQLEYWDSAGGNRPLGFDAPDEIITHIAVNPVDPDEIAIVTRAMSICISHDGGNTWNPVLAAGRGQ